MVTRQGPQAIPSEQALAESAEPREPAARASVADTARVVTRVLLPTLATGVIKRRPWVLALAQKLRAGRPAVDELRRLRRRYGMRPLRLRVPGRAIDLVLSPEEVGALLAGTPWPFSADTREKAAALGHFQPHGVLISEGHAREVRRKVNEAVLEPGREVHELAGPWARVLHDQADVLLRRTLDWDSFNEHWWIAVRQIVLGGDTAEDRELTDLLAQLRLDANWAYARPKHRKTRQRFLDLVRRQVALARPGSLAAALAAQPDNGVTDPAGQLPHWLFAFDAAGMAVFRTLALLATHPDSRAEAHAEPAGLDLTQPHQLPLLRAAVLESVRLWPTTPALLRESRTATAWGPEKTTFFIYTPFFHRDPDQLPCANTFDPALWLDGRAAANPALVPFSGGPGACPGRDLVLFTASTMLANLLQHHDFRLRDTILTPGDLPLTLDNFGLRFEVTVR
ncbi:cytochrome P450 [Amycolatopsis sp. FDAARGOS 1241]|uniref:cytochrome P450 n=1 Tax=Amycolatopsis sp. FDAARGOS 1241 TaxID=2778070 RepID=UPI00195140A4|nr:cytochrome P450 [Amycolatopsis sp. FDAARGOS 1241]QRP49669.1 cytochrome P450 [Amycolatopsis sp. FDAARGOS 1241]